MGVIYANRGFGKHRGRAIEGFAKSILAGKIREKGLGAVKGGGGFHVK